MAGNSWSGGWGCCGLGQWVGSLQCVEWGGGCQRAVRHCCSPSPGPASLGPPTLPCLTLPPCPDLWHPLGSQFCVLLPQSQVFLGGQRALSTGGKLCLLQQALTYSLPQGPAPCSSCGCLLAGRCAWKPAPRAAPDRGRRCHSSGLRWFLGGLLLLAGAVKRDAPGALPACLIPGLQLREEGKKPSAEGGG